jgi:hypothetical protein
VLALGVMAAVVVQVDLELRHLFHCQVLLPLQLVLEQQELPLEFNNKKPMVLILFFQQLPQLVVEAVHRFPTQKVLCMMENLVALVVVVVAQMPAHLMVAALETLHQLHHLKETMVARELSILQTTQAVVVVVLVQSALTAQTHQLVVMVAQERPLQFLEHL